jgi:hypothetical protein
MNVVLHALAGGAIAHASFQIAGVHEAKPSAATLLGAALAAIASHGLLDWLRHDYPLPSRLDVVLALALSGVWLGLVQPRLRLLFASAFAASFLPDVVDHLPRVFHVTSPWPTPVFPWHSPTWSGSLYPAAEIRAGSKLVALEVGNNRLVSTLNHAFVGSISLVSIFLGRSAFARPLRVSRN